MRYPRHFGAMADELYQRAAPLLEAEIDREIIALDRERGEVFGFNSVASDVSRRPFLLSHGDDEKGPHEAALRLN